MMLNQASMDRLADAVIAAIKIGQAAMQQRLASLEVTNTRLEERIGALERRLEQGATPHSSTDIDDVVGRYIQ